ncbi:MAG: hypothetical protein J6Y04_01210 [Bacteroidaceae bacterium]|nr:hypothetical protein [Bacteroidaceae bacterium]
METKGNAYQEEWENTLRGRSKNELLEILEKSGQYEEAFIHLVSQRLHDEFSIEDSEIENILREHKEQKKVAITSEYLRQNTGIHGWLSFFLFTITIGGLFCAIIQFVHFDMHELILSVGDVIYGVIIFVLSIYILYAFSYRKPNAVFLGKAYIITVFIVNLLTAIGGTDDKIHPYGSLIWGPIWFLYLQYSEQVKEVIPKTFRKIGKRDYLLVGSLIVIPLLFIIVSIMFPSIDTQYENEISYTAQDEVSQTSLADNRYKLSSLSENERTDERIVFAIPDGFSCERLEDSESGMIVYQLESEDNASIRICSGVDEDSSEKSFDDYASNWEEKDLKPHVRKRLPNVQHEIHDWEYRIKVVEYNVNGSILYWRFIMMYHKSLSVVCLLSCYDYGQDNYVHEILHSVRI